jgi:hypothetical protein
LTRKRPSCLRERVSWCEIRRDTKGLLIKTVFARDGWTIQPDFQNIFHPGGELSIHLILLSGGSPTPPFLHRAPRSVFRSGMNFD